MPAITLTPENLRAAYDLLRRIAFDDDQNLPMGRHVRFIACPLLKAHGYQAYTRKRHTIWVDASGTKTWTMALQILAHEMIHLARRDYLRNTEQEAHDTFFQEAARAVEHRMGWTNGSV